MPNKNNSSFNNPNLKSPNQQSMSESPSKLNKENSKENSDTIKRLK